jgi:hypothetical protein
MTCQLRPLTIPQRAFLECIRWSDAVYHEGILVVDIDFDAFSMNVMGEADHVNEFSSRVRKVFYEARDKISKLENENYGCV